MSLDTLLLWASTVTAIIIAAISLLRPDGMLRYPFLASTVYLGWFLPQAIGLANKPSLPAGGYATLMTMALLCLVAIYVADKAALPSSRARFWGYDERRLLIGSAALTVFGTFFAFQISSLPPEMLTGQWTGPATIYLFMAKTQYYGFSIAFLLVVRNFSFPALLIVIFNLNFLLYAIFIGGRRGVTIEVSLIMLTALWFERRIMLPRLLTIALVFIGSLLFNSIGEYRSLVYKNSSLGYGVAGGGIPTLDEIFSIDYTGMLKTFAEEGSYEVTNAVFYTSAISDNSDFNIGLTYWNDFIFRYVPGQLLGFDFKNSLMFELYDKASAINTYDRHIGTTATGFVDSFSAFWFFGALVFFTIGIVMRKYYERAMLGDFSSKLYYGLMLAFAMHAVTHSTSWFFIYLPQVFLFVWPVLWMARRRSSPGDILVGRRYTFGPKGASRRVANAQRFGP